MSLLRIGGFPASNCTPLACRRNRQSEADVPVKDETSTMSVRFFRVGAEKALAVRLPVGLLPAHRRAKRFGLFERDDEVSALRNENANLKVSLGRCQPLVDDCFSKLAANSNGAYRPTYPSDDRVEGQHPLSACGSK